MDELEISGKRYISTRRAAKDNKYHSDYIGQLIRAGKVEGQKVGRSWYVAADSLADYLGKEGAAKTPAVRVEPAVKVARVERTVEKVEIVEEEPEEIEEAPKVSKKKIYTEEETHIPVHVSRPVEIKKEIPVMKTTRGGLRYMADDGPLYPRVEREMPQPRIKVRTQPAPVVEEEIVFVEQQPVVILEKPKSKRNTRNFFVRSGAVVAVGVLTLGIVAAASAFVVSTVSVEGETATASYSLGGI